MIESMKVYFGYTVRQLLPMAGLAVVVLALKWAGWPMPFWLGQALSVIVGAAGVAWGMAWICQKDGGR